MITVLCLYIFFKSDVNLATLVVWTSETKTHGLCQCVCVCSGCVCFWWSGENTSLTPSTKWPRVRGQWIQVTVMSSGSTHNKAHLAWGKDGICCHTRVTCTSPGVTHTNTVTAGSEATVSPRLQCILRFSAQLWWISVCFLFVSSLHGQIYMKSQQMEADHCWLLLSFIPCYLKAPRVESLSLICSLYDALLQRFYCTWIWNGSKRLSKAQKPGDSFLPDPVDSQPDLSDISQDLFLSSSSKSAHWRVESFCRAGW